jgi:1-acyl-sn-glycerol-3-phosphate acyltransferase
MREFQRPTDRELNAAFLPLLPWRAICRPVFYGLDNIPNERPLLFVGNHQIFGGLDAPLLYYELFQKKGIFLRSLGDHHHFMVPIWRDFLHRFGAVDGTRENCRKLFADGECVLVFPGGGREVAKRKNERYQLIWKERMGFVRMAIEAGCTIVPFAAVGVEDWFDILLDGDEIMDSSIGKILEKMGVPRYGVWPIVKSAGGLLPRSLQQSFYIAEAYPTQHLKGKQEDDALCREVRDAIKSRVESGIQYLLQQREKDHGNT